MGPRHPTAPSPLSLPIAGGTNPIRLTATDPPATTSAELTVRRGRASSGVGQRVELFHQPEVAADRDPPRRAGGRPRWPPAEGARVTFTLSIPGIKTVTGDGVTDADGYRHPSRRAS